MISRPLLRIRALTKAGAIEPAVATIYAAPASAIMFPPGIAANLAAINVAPNLSAIVAAGID